MLFKEHSIVIVWNEQQFVSGSKDMLNKQLITVLFHFELQ
jgi:hypothetical protein